MGVLLDADDYFRLTPPDSHGWELIGGALVVSPKPTVRHQRLAKRLLRALLVLEDAGLGEVLGEVNDVLSEHDVLEPDLVFVRAGRAEIVEPHAVVGAPDLVIEILSPSTRARDLRDKRRLYARAGVPCYWTVDPDGDRIDVRRLQGAGYRRALVFRPPQVLTLDEFPGLRVDLTALFAR
jgi:Uma2 family endonuclease